MPGVKDNPLDAVRCSFLNDPATLSISNGSLSQQEIHSHLRTLPTLLHTRNLHQNIGTTIELRECVRIHKSFFKHLCRGVSKMKKGKDQRNLTALQERLEDSISSLDFYECALETTKEQLLNLMSLVGFLQRLPA